jgi:membrane protein
VTVVSRITGQYERTVARTRERSGLVDHVFRAKDRYTDAFGGRLAAAIAYYGFFATFALGVVAYSVLGFLLEYRVDLKATVDEFLQENLPVMDTTQISQGRGAASVFGVVGLVFAGVAWVEALRSSQRRIWELEQAPGNMFLRRAIDVVVLIGLTLLLGGSFALALGIEHLLRELPAGMVLARAGGWLLTIGVNLILALALLIALPRLRISPRRLLPPALAVAVGIFLLNTVGVLYVDRVQANPAYAVVATAAGLLVYLYLFHQLVLAAAAWAATSHHGRVVDLTASRAEPPAAAPADGQ